MVPPTRQGSQGRPDDGPIGQAIQVSRDEFVQMKSQLQLLTSMASSGSLPGVTSTNNTDEEGEKPPPEVLSVMRVFRGIAAKDLLAIWRGKFEPLNLMKLAPALHDIEVKPMSSHEDMHWDPTELKIKLGSQTGNVRDFGNTPVKWSIAFSRYALICYYFFGEKHPSLLCSMMNFQTEIMVLTTTYPWYSVLRLALSVHQSAIMFGQTIGESWVIPPRQQDEYCRNPLKRLSTESQPQGVSSKKKPNNQQSPPCRKFNSADGCIYTNCRYKHICDQCHASSHNKLSCGNAP